MAATKVNHTKTHVPINVVRVVPTKKILNMIISQCS